MKRIITLGCLLIFVLFYTGCAHYRYLREHDKSELNQLRSKLDELFNKPETANAIWGVDIRSMESGKIIYQKNSGTNLMPASNMKLFTTAAALHYLGPDYQYETKIIGTGGLTPEGILKGDLIIQGSGDPSISGRYSRGSTTSIAILETWIDGLKDRGIKIIQGNIIGDDDIFDDNALIYSWNWGYIPSAFAAQMSGLNFDDNSFNLYLLPGNNAGEPAIHWLRIDTDYLNINNQVMTVPKNSRTNINITRDWNTNDIHVTGQIALGANTAREWGSVHNPTLYLTTIFYELLNKNGIEIYGKPKDIDELTKHEKEILYKNNPEIFYIHSSHTMSDIVRIVNKVSQNLYAEQLLKTIGKEIHGEGSTRKGVNAVREFLGSIGIDTSQYYMVDGSGLSRSNIIQPQQIIQLLKAMYNHPHKDIFFNSLPIAGVDGTISRRMRGTSAENNLRAKTGFIGYVRCLSGYVTSRDNETLLFSFMANHYTIPTENIEEIQDQASILLSDFSRK